LTGISFAPSAAGDHLRRSRIVTDRWDEGTAYDRFMGRWSRPIAPRFLDWLSVAGGADWLDVGCGTGALLWTIAATAAPGRLAGVDPSERFIEHARGDLPDSAQLLVARAEHLPFAAGAFDAAVSGLVLNFIPDPVTAVAEMRRVCRPGGVVAAFVWDYAEGMRSLRLFWDAAAQLDPAAADLDEGRRFPLCRPEPLADLFSQAGMADVRTTALEAVRSFASFDDHWQPFLAGQGPAGTYLAGLNPDRQAALADRLRERLPAEPNGSILLSARAWAVRGTV
jgi:SAM-dependent methyltransferase